MTDVDVERVDQAKFRAAQRLDEAEGENDLIAASYWRGLMESFAEVVKGRWGADGDGPLHPGEIPPDVQAWEASPSSSTATLAKVVGMVLILLAVIALFWGAWEMGGTLVSIVS